MPLFAKAKPNDGEGFIMTCVACLTAPTLRQHSLFLKLAFELVEEDTLIEFFADLSGEVGGLRETSKSQVRGHTTTGSGDILKTV